MFVQKLGFHVRYIFLRLNVRDIHNSTTASQRFSLKDLSTGLKCQVNIAVQKQLYGRYVKDENDELLSMPWLVAKPQFVFFLSWIASPHLSMALQKRTTICKAYLTFDRVDDGAV